jgi:hypothetical protein
MDRLTLERIESYRAQTFRTRPGQHIATQEQAIDHVNERGCIYFWPIKDIVFPSLWVAVAGDRPVADAHDDPGHVTWGWKDSLLGERRWYYAKVLRKRATMISLEVAPYFYALSENYGEPAEDYLALYQQGKMTQESKLIYEALLDKGVLDTIALRRATHLTSKESDSRFNRAMTELQADFKILPVAVTQSGAWRYAFAYDLVHRHYPELPEQARFIQENQARQELARLYFRSVGAAQAADLVKLFGWIAPEVERAIEGLERVGELCRGLGIENRPGEWIALAELVEA